MNAPANLKSAAHCLIAAGFVYLFLVSWGLYFGGRRLDGLDKVFVGCLASLGLLLWLSAFLLYRCNAVGKWIWWACCPIVLLQFPIGTALGVFAFIYLEKPDSKAALAGRTVAEPPPLPPQ